MFETVCFFRLYLFTQKTEKFKLVYKSVCSWIFKSKMKLGESMMHGGLVYISQNVWIYSVYIAFFSFGIVAGIIGTWRRDFYNDSFLGPFGTLWKLSSTIVPFRSHAVLSRKLPLSNIDGTVTVPWWCWRTLVDFWGRNSERGQKQRIVVLFGRNRKIDSRFLFSGNTLIIGTILHVNKLRRSPSFLLILNMSFSDLIVSVATGTFTLIGKLYRYGEFAKDF